MGLDQHKQRETELDLFVSGQRQALRNEQERISDILTKFEELHEEVSCFGGSGVFFSQPGEISAASVPV